MTAFLYTVFVYPFGFCMKAAFNTIYGLVHSCGLAIICVCLVVNIALLPFYIKAGTWNAEERALRKQILPKEQMIRRCFKGQERFAMLSTMRRQAGFSHLKSFGSYVGIFLQIFIFSAAWNIFSALPVLKEASFGSIHNLSEPDGLLHLWGLQLNFLPLLAAGIGFCVVFFLMRGISDVKRCLICILITAFLFLLYNASATLSLYWLTFSISFLLWNIIRKCRL